MLNRRHLAAATAAIVLAAGVAATRAARAQIPAPATGERVPVLVELFTSEGCSSCPPADEVLTKLVTTQPVAGAEVIALGEHVDYWDRLGWRDPFSSAAFTARQSDYASRVFRTGDVYTPQIVVNGRDQLVGSDYRAATTAIARAAAGARLRVSLSAEHNPPQSSARVSTRAAATDGSAPITTAAEMFLAIVEDGLVTNVKRGENSGRQLRHSAVVRLLTSAGPVDSKPWSAETTLHVASDWKVDRLRVVAFVQERATRHVLGAAATRLRVGVEP